MEKWLYVMFIERGKSHNKITKAVVERHAQNIRKLDDNGQLELCGVFKGYPGVAGMYIMKAKSYEEAEEFCKLEPLIIEGYATYKLRDLGCGPGICAELFDDAGYQVTGIDLSNRSIDYANRSAEAKRKAITYSVCNYLSMDYREQFDVATLIYCDFGVLSTADRAALLKKIYTALRPNGRLIFDVFTPWQYVGPEVSVDTMPSNTETKPLDSFRRATSRPALAMLPPEMVKSPEPIFAIWITLGWLSLVFLLT